MAAEDVGDPPQFGVYLVVAFRQDENGALGFWSVYLLPWTGELADFRLSVGGGTLVSAFKDGHFRWMVTFFTCCP